MQHHIVVLDAHAEPLGQVVDRPLQSRIVERHELPALLAHKMMVVLAARLGPFEPRLPVADGHALDEPVLGQQIEHAIDARAAGRLALCPERILDLDRAQGARLPCQEVNDSLTGAAALETRSRQLVVYVFAPVHTGFKLTLDSGKQE